MLKNYSNPVIEIKKYKLSSSQYVTTSDLETDENGSNKDLNTDDKYEYFSD